MSLDSDPSVGAFAYRHQQDDRVDQVRLVDFNQLVDAHDAVQGVDVVLAPLGVLQQRVGQFGAARRTALATDDGALVAQVRVGGCELMLSM